jgi:chromosomal replication initiator protein
LRIWFKGSFGTALEGHTLTVAVPNPFAKEYIESRFGGLLEEALTGHLGEDAWLEVIVSECSNERADQRV